MIRSNKQVLSFEWMECSMKKSVTIVAAALAGTLGFAGTAMAYGPYPVYPSPDFTKFWSVWTIGHYEGNDNPDADRYAVIVGDLTNEQYQEAAALADTFDATTINDADNAAIFKAIDADETEEAVCHEVIPLVIKDYAGGALNFKVTFPVDYKYLLCEHVGIYINVTDVDGNVKTYVVQGSVTDQGVIQFHLNAEASEAVAKGTAYIAVFSAE